VEIDVAEDMTRLTLDTIALCAFDVRFNSFYSENHHPFVGAMVGALTEAGLRSERLPGVQPFMVGTNRRYREGSGRRSAWNISARCSPNSTLA
jgi:cytochrome P450/NADPH-cytochrome P450 reductase